MELNLTFGVLALVANYGTPLFVRSRRGTTSALPTCAVVASTEAVTGPEGGFAGTAPQPIGPHTR